VITAPQALEKQPLRWDEISLCDAQLKDTNTGPASGWCAAGKRPDWSDFDSASLTLRALCRQFETVKY